MSKSYTAWNGEEYPWPPPEGWYEASDGKWWAKDSGPGPKQANQPAASQDASERPTQAVLPDSQNQPQANQNPATQNQPTTPFNSPQQQAPFGANPQNQPAQFGQPQQFNNPGQRQPGFGQPQQFGQSNWQSAPAQKKGNTGLIIGLCAGAAALVLLIGGLFVALSGDDEEPFAAPVPTTPTTIAIPTTPSTLAPTTTIEPTTTTEVDFAVATAGFRAHLISIDVDASEATDQQLEAAAVATCTVAIFSLTPADWDEDSEELVETSLQNQIDSGNDAPLTRNQWRSLISGRLVFYCPDEATRLDVSI